MKKAEQRARRIRFFDNATFRNIATMMKKISDSTTPAEHLAAQQAIQAGKETVLGREPGRVVITQMNQKENDNG